MKHNFIRTFDKETATKLINSGYKLIDNKDGSWLFINQNTLTFSGEEAGKIMYTNILSI